MVPPRRPRAVAALAVLIPLAALAQEVPAGRRPVPGAERQKEAEQTVRRLFKEEYEKKSAADRRTLAAALLESALKGGEGPDLQFVLLREAREIAAQAGDLETAFRSIDEMARGFDVEAPPLKLAVLAAASKGRPSGEGGGLAARALALADEAAAAGDYETAEKALQAAGGMARRSGDAALGARAAGRAREISDLKARYEKVKKDRETLRRNPADPAANLEYGRFLCPDVGAWDRGLPLLARGADDDLRSLAERDLAGPSDPDGQTRMGLSWLKMAEKEKGDRRDRCLDRAVHWYERALAGVSGPDREAILGRLRGLPPSRRPIDLLRLVDPSRDTVFGTWTAADGALVSDDSKFARFQIPYRPPAEYDLHVTFVRMEGREQVVVFLSQKGRGFAWAISEEGGGCCAWLTVRDQWNSRSNPTYAALPGELVDGKPCTVVFEVRAGRVRPLLGGRPTGEYAGDFANLELPSWLELRDPGALGIGSYQSPTRVLRIELTEVTGRGHRVLP